MFKNEIIIREFENRDLALIVDFEKETMSDIWSDEYEKMFYKNFKILDNQILMIALIDKVIVGRCYCTIHDRYVDLEEFMVREKYRSKKIGEKIISCILNRFTGKVDYLELFVTKDNEKAIKFYDKIGFKMINDRVNAIDMRYYY